MSSAGINRIIPHVPFVIKFGIPDNLHCYDFTSHDLVCLAISSIVGVWYLLKKVRFKHLICLILYPVGVNSLTISGQ